MFRAIVVLVCVVIVCSKRLGKEDSINSPERRADFFETKIRMARLSKTTPRTIDVVDWCEPNPCKNGATCRVHDTCLCATGWSGLYCDFKVTDKLSSP